MSVAYVLIFVFTIICVKNKFGNYFNFINVFVGFWALCGFISTLGLYDLIKPSNQIHILCIMFILTMDVVMLNFMHSKNQIHKNNVEIDDLELGNLPNIMQIISFLLISVIFFRALSSVFSGGFSAVRSSFYSSDYSGKYMFNLLCRQAPIGMIEGLIIYYTYASFAYKKPKYLINAVLNVLVVTIASGGRYEVVFFVLAVLMTLIISGNAIEQEALHWAKKYKKYVFTIAGAVIAVGIYITLSARNGGVIKGLISYSSGSLSFLDIIMRHPNSFGLNSKLYGYMTFSVITEPIVLLMKFCGLTTVKAPSWFFNTYCQPFYNISTGTTPLYFNNNTSIIYFLYSDFGWIGTIIG